MSTTQPHHSSVGGAGPMLLAVGSVLTFFGLFVVGLRAYAASHTGGRWRWDFIWAAASVFCGVIASSFYITAVTFGLGNQFKKVPLHDVFLAMKWTWVTLYVGLIALTLAKFSCVALLMTIQPPSARKRRAILWVIAITFACVNIVQIFLTAFQCAPARRLWYRLMPGTCSGGKVAGHWSYMQGSVGAFTDVVLALWPISLAWNLQTSMRVKVGFCGLMALGTLPAIASGMRTKALPAITGAKNITHDLAPFMLWCVVELYSIIILTSIPVLRPLFLRVFYGIKTVTSRGTNNGTAGMSKGATGNHSMAAGNTQMSKISRKKGHAVELSVLDVEKDGSMENVLANDHATANAKSQGIYVAREYDVRESAVEVPADEWPSVKRMPSAKKSPSRSPPTTYPHKF